MQPNRQEQTLSTSSNLNSVSGTPLSTSVSTSAYTNESFRSANSLISSTASFDSAGNTLTTARQITVGSTATNFSDWVGTTDTNDYYRFSVTQNTNLNLTLSRLSGDADLSLLDSNGNTITSSTNSGTANDSINRQLQQGTYFIRVFPMFGVNTNYNLAVAATPVTPSIPDLAGNILSTARQISVGSTPTNFSDWVGTTDTNDYYRFSVTQNTNLNLTLNGLNGDADLSLLDSNGNTITSSRNFGTANEFINLQLQQGNYFIRVFPMSGVNTNYNLSVAATPIAPPLPIDLAPNTLATARQISVGSTATTFTDWVGTADTNDYYRFNVTQTSNLNVTLSGLSGDADLTLLDSNGNTITSSNNFGTTNDSINRQLQQGNYFIRVFPMSGTNTNYNLSVAATPIAPPPPIDLAPNTLATARQISVGSTATTFTDWVGTADTNDYYRFNVTQTSNLNVTLSGLSGDADLSLLDSNGNTITSSNNFGTANDSINRQLQQGNYFIRVFPMSGTNTNYNLSVAATPIAPPLPIDLAPNTLATARQISVGSTATTYTDWVGTADTNDYYRFNVTQTSNLNVTLSGLSGDADLTLLDSNGNTITSSNNFGTTNDSINRQLQQGTYFIQVNPMFGVNTNYNLSVAANPVAPLPLPPVTPTTADWTFLVYVAGDNLERFGIQDFLEMSAVGSNSNVNIVVQFDRTSGYDNSYGDWTDTRRGLVRRGDTPGLNWGTSIGEVNMGDAGTLRNFLSWGTSNYQANNYALVMWGHGDGVGTAYDDINRDTITSSELSSVLGGLSSRMSLIATDSCLMGMTEFAYGIRNQASVFVGSQELVPGAGFNYTTVLSDLTANSKITAASLGSIMVNRYRQQYGSFADGDTLSAINLEALSEFTRSLSSFATTFMGSSTSSDRNRLATYRNGSGEFGDGYFSEYRDLGTMMSRVANDTTMNAAIRNAAGNTLRAYNGAIISNFSDIDGRGTGLSIYFQERGYLASGYSNSYQAFTSETNWDEFLNWWQNA